MIIETLYRVGLVGIFFCVAAYGFAYTQSKFRTLFLRHARMLSSAVAALLLGAGFLCWSQEQSVSFQQTVVGISKDVRELTTTEIDPF